MNNKFIIPKNILENFDIAAIQRRMSQANWYYQFLEDPISWLECYLKMEKINKDLLLLCVSRDGKETANELWNAYVPKDSINKPDYLTTNLFVMNQKNFDYLSNQIKLTGFGESHNEELKEKIQKQTPDFVITHKQDFGKDSTVAQLQFRKSDQNEMYFFNKYSLEVKTPQNNEPLKQTFYKDDNITLKEGYNLMNGRAVETQKLNAKNEKYTVWYVLNFKETDKNGNFKLHPYHSNYGFDLEKSLARHPIKELQDETSKTRLMESLKRGNRQSVTIDVNGQGRKVFVEAAAQFKSLNFYDSNQQPIKADKLYEGRNEKQPVKQDAKKENQKQNSGDEDGPAGKGEKKSRRKKQSIS